MNRTDSRNTAYSLGLLACVLFGLIHVLYYWPEVIDDSYIVFRYARNFMRGDGLAFNPGGLQVEGFSTLTWFWLSAWSLKLGARDLLVFVKLAGLAFYLATIVGAWALARAGDRHARGLALLAP